MKRLILLILCLVLLAACGGEKVVLLPDLDGHVGEVTVNAKTGESVTLTEANQSVSGKTKVYTMSDDEVESVFGPALAAQPEPTAKFLMYFHNDSAKLTKESAKKFPEIVKSYKDRSSTDISVIGHSDAVGDKQYNYDLSYRRAMAIKKLLIKNGVPEDIIQTTSHGEENPLIPTEDGVREPRNRRVEVLVR